MDVLLIHWPEEFRFQKDSPDEAVGLLRARDGDLQSSQRTRVVFSVGGPPSSRRKSRKACGPGGLGGGEGRRSCGGYWNFVGNVGLVGGRILKPYFRAWKDSVVVVTTPGMDGIVGTGVNEQSGAMASNSSIFSFHLASLRLVSNRPCGVIEPTIARSGNRLPIPPWSLRRCATTGPPHFIHPTPIPMLTPTILLAQQNSHRGVIP